MILTISNFQFQDWLKQTNAPLPQQTLRRIVGSNHKVYLFPVRNAKKFTHFLKVKQKQKFDQLDHEEGITNEPMNQQQGLPSEP